MENLVILDKDGVFTGFNTLSFSFFAVKNQPHNLGKHIDKNTRYCIMYR